jgi:hypothetical protein
MDDMPNNNDIIEYIINLQKQLDRIEEKLDIIIGADKQDDNKVPHIAGYDLNTSNSTNMFSFFVGGC